MSLGYQKMLFKQKKYKEEKNKEKSKENLQNLKGFASPTPIKIPTVEEKVAEQMRSATKPTAKERITDIGTRIGGATSYGLLNDEEKAARDKGILNRTANSSGFRVASGVAAGLSPITKKLDGNETQKKIQQIRDNSTGFKAGRIAGEIGSFAIPYAGAAGKIGKVVSKAPAVAKMGKVGQNVAKSVATDIAVGVPLNINYAFNKEGLKGEDAAKSIAINTGMDLALGGVFEVAGPAIKKFAKDLSERLGRTVTDEEAFDILREKKREYIATNKDISEEEKGKLLRELAEESNRRKGKSVANTEVLYGNSTRMPVADLPEPKGNKTGLYQMENEINHLADTESKGSPVNHIEQKANTPSLKNKTIPTPQEMVKAQMETTGIKPINTQSPKIPEGHEVVKTVNGYNITRRKGTQGYYNVTLKEIANGREFVTFRTQKAAEEYIRKMTERPEPLPSPQEMVKAQMEAAGVKQTEKASTPPTKIPTEKEMVERQMKGGGQERETEKAIKEMGLLGKVYSKLFDNLYGLGRTGEKLKIYAANMRKARGTADYVRHNGMVDMAGRDISHKRLDGSKVSLEKIFNDAADIDLEAFNDYLLHRHNIDRARQGKNVFNDVSSAESKKRVNDILMQYPEFKQLGDELSAINEQVINEWMVKSGLINKELGDKLQKLYPGYVPTYRETDKGIEQLRKEGFKTKTIKANKIVNEATGGIDPVIAPNISVAAQIQKVFRAARMNEIALQLAKEIKNNPEKFKNVARISDDTAVDKYGNTVAKNAMESLEENGLEGLDRAMEQLIGVDEASRYFVVAMDNGKPIRMIVNKDIYDALDALNKVKDDETASKIINFMNKALSQPFKAAITVYNPFFGVRNILRDTPTAYIQGTEHNPIRFVGNQIQAYHDIMTNDPLWQQYQAMGGKRSGYFNTQKGIAADRGLAEDTKKFFRKLLDGIALFNETTESATRYAEFRGTLKRMGKLDDPVYEDLQKALYNSGEVTVDFLRSGDVTKTIDKIVPYLNPAVQGIDKFLRTMATSPAAWIKGLTTLTIPSIALYEYNQRFHKEDYDKLDDRTKDNYYCFYIPDSDGKFVKIPKARESGVLFQALAERILRQIAGDEDAFKNFGNTVATNFAPQNPIENNIFSPITYNLPSNKDFANRTIVPERLKGYKKSEQYDEKTSELAKWLGDAAAQLGINDGEGLSPKQIDYIIDSYTGIIGDILIPATTQGGDVFGKVVTRPFTVDNVYSNSIQNNFYEEMEKAEKEKNSVNLRDEIASEFKTPEEYRYSLYTAASKEMGELRKVERKYQQLPQSEMKEKYLRELRKEINAIAEQTSAEADQLVKEYERTYIPEISDMSDEKQAYYRDNLKNLGIDAAELRQVYNSLDLNGSGTVSQDEAYAILEQTNYTREQKAVIWNFINSGWKKNPYI